MHHPTGIYLFDGEEPPIFDDKNFGVIQIFGATQSQPRSVGKEDTAMEKKIGGEQRLSKEIKKLKAVVEDLKRDLNYTQTRRSAEQDAFREAITAMVEAYK